jgi:hypothetical protein
MLDKNRRPDTFVTLYIVVTVLTVACLFINYIDYSAALKKAAIECEGHTSACWEMVGYKNMLAMVVGGALFLLTTAVAVVWWLIRKFFLKKA